MPLVSTDYINERRPGVVDAPCTQVIDGTMVKVYAWYGEAHAARGPWAAAAMCHVACCERCTPGTLPPSAPAGMERLEHCLLRPLGALLQLWSCSLSCRPSSP
jgi:hypothetical protein